MTNNIVLSICSSLYVVCAKAPWLRIGQVLCNFIKHCENNGKDPFYMNDEEFAAAFTSYIEDMK